MKILERAGVLDRLELLRLRCRSEETSVRRGAVALLEGPRGSGRTTVLSETANRALTGGTTVLTACGFPSDRDLPFGLAGQLFRAPAWSAARRSGLEEILARAADGPGDRAGSVPVETAQAFDELVGHLLALADEATVLLTVDDVTHGDRHSLQFLAHLARRVGAHPILMVVAMEDRAASRLWRGLGALPHTERIPVSPLSAAGAAELLGDLGPGRGTASAGRTHQLTGGSPLLLAALVEDYRSTGCPTAAGLGHAVLGLLHRGAPSLLRAARAVAVGGDRSAIADLVGATGPEGDSLQRAAESLDAAGVLDEHGFRHPVVREAVLADIPEPVRAALHHRAAVRAHRQGRPVQEIADHLVLGRGAAALDAWGLTTLRQAADLALLASAPERAVRFLRVAVDACDDDTVREDLVARLVRATWFVEPADASPHLVESAGSANVRDAVEAVRQLLWHGRVDDAVAALAGLRSRGGSRALLLDVFRWSATEYPAVAALAAAHRPVEREGARHAERWLHVAARLATALRTGAAPDSIGEAEAALRGLVHARADGWAEEAAVQALHVLLAGGRRDLASSWAARVADEATPLLVSRSGRARAGAFLGLVALERGELRAAVQHAERALSALPAQSWGAGAGTPRAVLVEAYSRLGEHDSAAGALLPGLPDTAFDTPGGVRFRHARAVHRLETGYAAEAVTDFLTCGSDMSTWGVDVAGVTGWRAGAARAWLDLGDPDRARRLVGDELASAGVETPRRRAAALRVQAATSPPGRRIAPLTEALDLLERSADRVEEAHVLADLSHAYDALGDRRRARLLSRRALHLAEAAEVQPLVDSLNVASGEREGFAPGPTMGEVADVLSDSERRVAGLAVMGHTNREIATRLYVTPSTVEQHLTRVYRKLGVRRRRDLPVDLVSAS